MPSEREERLAQADRLIRRGELPEAIEILRLLHNLFPDDPPIAARLAAVTDLSDPRSRPPSRPTVAVAPPPVPPPLNPEEIAEQRIAQGDVATGVAIYEKLLAKLPDHPRARARLESLRPAPPPPADPVDTLTALLDRVQQRRR